MATGESLNIYELDKFNPEDFYIPLNFSVADFRDISNRNGYYSKTIEIPSTKKNDSLLGQSFDISAEGFFDRNKKQKAYIERDGIVYLDGFMQLKAVELKDGKPYKYKIVLYSSLSEWGGLIDGDITDFDYTTVTLNAENVEASWSNNGLTDEYVFPLINYNNLVGSDYTTNISPNDLLPGVFVFHILKKIFNEVGYELKPGIFYDKRISNLFIPTIEGEVSASRKFLDTQGGGVYSPGADYGFTNLIYTGSGVTSDLITYERYTLTNSLNNFNTATGRFTAPFDCTVTSSARIDVVNRQITNSNSVTIKIRHYNSGGVLQGDVALLNQVIPAGIVKRTYNLNVDSLDLSSGDYLITTITSGNGVNTLLNVKYRKFDVRIDSTPTIQVGDEIGVGDYLPEISKKNLVKSIIQMFNLYHVTDERNKTVEFLTRDDFYKAISDSDDWTEKVDYSKSIEIEQLDRNLAKEFEFKYKEDDNDELIKEFKSRYGVTLGDYTETLDNEFLKDSKTVADIPFAPTYSSGTLDQSDGESIPLPWIPNNYGTVNDKISLENRILIYDGLIDKAWTFNSVSKTQMPFSHFVRKDSSFNDISLSFRSFRLYNTAIRQSDFGLFERFYKEQVKMLNSSRLCTFYLKLSPVDILNLDFRKPKYIRGNYYYLNKIEDYKTGTEETVKVELINIP